MGVDHGLDWGEPPLPIFRGSTRFYGVILMLTFLNKILWCHTLATQKELKLSRSSQIFVAGFAALGRQRPLGPIAEAAGGLSFELRLSQKSHEISAPATSQRTEVFVF